MKKLTARIRWAKLLFAVAFAGAAILSATTGLLAPTDGMVILFWVGFAAFLWSLLLDGYLLWSYVRIIELVTGPLPFWRMFFGRGLEWRDLADSAKTAQELVLAYERRAEYVPGLRGDVREELRKKGFVAVTLRLYDAERAAGVPPVFLSQIPILI